MTGEQIGLIVLGILFLGMCAVLNKTVEQARIHSQWTEEKRLKDVQAYIKVLDVARRFNPDRKSIYSMQGVNPGFTMARFRAHETSMNEDIDALHAAFKELARYFDEEDPCPCQRCYVSRATKGMSAREVFGLMRGEQLFR